jgi:hypothetical protein
VLLPEFWVLDCLFSHIPTTRQYPAIPGNTRTLAGFLAAYCRLTVRVLPRILRPVRVCSPRIGKERGALLPVFPAAGPSPCAPSLVSQAAPSGPKRPTPSVSICGRELFFPHSDAGNQPLTTNQRWEGRHVAVREFPWPRARRLAPRAFRLNCQRTRLCANQRKNPKIFGSFLLFPFPRTPMAFTRGCPPQPTLKTIYHILGLSNSRKD